MEGPLAEKLFATAEAFCAEKGISLQRLAQEVLGEPKFFSKLKRGRGFTSRTFDRFQAHFEENGWHEQIDPQQ